MYEDQTVPVIQERMLDNIPSRVDKREGSIAYDAVVPTAIELMLLYASIDWFHTNTFGDTAEREYLIRLAKERGLYPLEATYAVGKMETTPETVDVPLGSRFSLDDVNYVVTEKIAPTTYLVRCETAGTMGNKPNYRLIPIDFIKGLQTATLSEISVPGEEEEDTEAFRTRYLNSFKTQAYGGNIADYKEKVNSLDGVGGVKVYPVWQGGGTVRIVFMTSEYKPPTDEHIRIVQEQIDPVGIQGLGVGIAPIGHIVTVQGAKNSKVRIDFNITFVEGDTFGQHKAEICEIIDNYFLELNTKWENTQRVNQSTFINTGLTIRLVELESRIFALESVTDVQHTKLNGLEENLTLDVDELAVRGEVIG